MNHLEFRYRIIKLSDLSEKQSRKLQRCLAKHGIKTRGGVVCESHWDVYDEVEAIVLGNNK